MIQLLRVCIVSCYVLFSFAFANDLALNHALKQQSVTQIISAIELHYLDRAIADKVVADLSSDYLNSASSPKETIPQFIRQLNKDLLKSSGDGYLTVNFKESIFIGKGFDNHVLDKKNEGVSEAKYLSNHIGYLKLGSLKPSDNVRQALDSALTSLSQSKALILDLRHLEEADIEQVQYLLSYFLPRDTTLATFSNPKDNMMFTAKTSDDISGERFDSSVAIYILSSPFLEQGAELLAYSLQRQGRAVVVGKPTMGVAIWRKKITISDSFILEVPFAKAMLPESNDNWEGNGIDPDVDADVEQSLELAHQLARSYLNK
ncbi:hypothetical protein HII17_02325 [Thalassotalea sp. M1531]|uniref:Tail specific protease domain-containing protein n=1 Tax=Thalassotalea algicola TaxID=2716224 RepID=A0A7Y0L9L6_9GAMM|nr:S41 family peptidase [Thalassotalea algicola]NMP30386.1 hypothetical protein [Thalassotalea algicola]